MILLIFALCFLATMNSGIAQSTDNAEKNMTVLRQDSGTNLSDMNYELYTSGKDWGIETFDIGEAVKFTTPKSDWKLKQIWVLGWNGYNETSKTAPSYPSNFLIEIRDDQLDLLYRLADTQNAYFTFGAPAIRAIDIPALPVTDEFYIIFYDRSAMMIGMEIENGTGNSYFYRNWNSELIPAEYRIEGAEATSVNWIIRAVGN